MMHTIDEQLLAVLPTVMKPGRYIGNELNAIHKPWQKAEVRFALAFPDVYEIGMSHIGMTVLYHQLNKQPWILAERVFSPWVDMDRQLRKRQIPLFTLESHRPVRHFDVLGITLQYELQYTNVLNLLDLAGIPLYSSERTPQDPLVLAGGPCAFNPEPVADFFDAVLIGDGEEAVLEIAAVVREARLHRRERHELFKSLAKIRGMYIPQLHQPSGKSVQTGIVEKEEVKNPVNARIEPELKPEYYPDKPIVPFIEVSHDRLSLEIMRGCARGCRFCGAGMLYRPVRIRPVSDLIKQTETVLKYTGYDELSLVSLSTSDYPCLNTYIQKMVPHFRREHITLSFPSLRAETFTPDMADLAEGLKKGGITLAPEAATQRLRDVLNKNITEEQLFGALNTAFDKGWKRVKLYFMIGLPTETFEDIKAIVSLTKRIVQLSKKYGRKEIHISISPFSPKPNSPFQWAAQDPIMQIEKKTDYLKQEIRWPQVKLSWRDPHVSELETVLGRGDRKLSAVIFSAWKQGAQFDAWSDQFQKEIWENAFREAEISRTQYVKAIPTDADLPWDHLNKGIDKSFLLAEAKNGETGKITKDCLYHACHGCGLSKEMDCETVMQKPVTIDSDAYKVSEKQVKTALNPVVTQKIRIQYIKDESVRFISHLDTIRMFARTFRRARLPVAMTRGFHPRPKIATATPLTLGHTSEAEYMDIDLIPPYPKDIHERLTHHLPEGFRVSKILPIYGKAPSLTSVITHTRYMVSWEGEPNVLNFQERIDQFIHSNECMVIRKNKQVDIRIFVADIQILKQKLQITIKVGQQGTARVDEVLNAISGPGDELPDVVRVHRIGQFIQTRNDFISPMENQ